MPTSPMNEVVQHLRSLLSPHGEELTDGQLLECFLSRREPAALEALVRRHGPMVWGVCRRILGDYHDAEDAFQATFLILVRKAASVSPRSKVGNWLYGVARQTALKARANRATRRQRERPVSPMPEPAMMDPERHDDLLALLDEAIGRLPAHYREVIVLCELGGKAVKDAALVLGCPEGTVASRLARGRAMLAKRLARHGLAAAAALAALLANEAAAAVPAPVMNSTINAVTAVAAGQAAAVVAGPAAALTEGVLKMMLLKKLTQWTAALLAIAMLGGMSWLIYQTQAAGSPQASAEPQQPKTPKREEADRARSVIDKAIQAQGGAANLARAKVVRQKGTIRRFIDETQETVVISYEQIDQAPERLKNVLRVVIDGNKLVQVIVVNGNRGWASSNGQTQEMEKGQLASVKEEMYDGTLTSLLPLRGKEYELSILPDAMVTGRPAVGVKVAAKGHADTRLYFDKESGLLVKRARQVPDENGDPVTEEAIFSDYQETDKIKWSRTQTTFMDGKKMAEARVTELQFLEKIADKVFDRPEGPLDDASPPPAKEVDKQPRQAQQQPIDLKWRPAKVAGPAGRYLVLVDAGKGDEYLPAAEAMAALHGAEVRRFDPSHLDRTLAELRKAPPRFVVFVLPPEKIDVDLSHAILEMATKVDDDPFVDFEYAFITGRDGPAALRFVQRIERAWRRETGDKAALFGSWEGAILPAASRLSAMKALGLTAKDRYVKARDPEENRLKEARQILDACTGSDALIFMSHGYADRMDLCFSGKNLRDWQIDLSPAILFNCACFNGAPGRWFEPTGKGYTDRGVIGRDDSVALALLDSGIAGYFAGVDTWHGPLNSQVFYYVTDDGMRLGEAANAMYNRLALEVQPQRLHFEPVLKRKRGGKDAWIQNQRDNGAAMILYGDPALAPFAKRAKHLLSARAEPAGNGLNVKITAKPLIDGAPGEDFYVLAANRLFDYYSLRGDPQKTPPQLELYRIVPLPAGTNGIASLRVVSARSGAKDIPTGKVQVAVEDTPDGRFLHVRVPLQVSYFENLRVIGLARQGLTVELEGSR